MIFPVFFLYPCLLFQSLVNSAAVELGSHIAPSPPSLSNDLLVNNTRRQSINSGRSAGASLSSNVARSTRRREATSSFHNGPPEDSPPSRNASRRLQTRQVSTSEWVFSSLVNPPNQPSSSHHQRRGNTPPGLTYRSIPLAPSSSSNYYTNYYRNTNIYAHPGRHSEPTPKVSSVHHSNEDVKVGRADANPGLDLGLNGRRASASSLSVVNKGATAGSDAPTSTSRAPGASADFVTMSHSRTAPATDPSLQLTGRPTSTQEMQISSDNEQDESSTTTTPQKDDDALLGSRAEIGKKRGKQMSDDFGIDSRHPLYFAEDVSPIVFPGRTTASGPGRMDTATEEEDKDTFRPFIRPSGKSGDSFVYPKLDVVDAHVIEQYNKLTELKRKSQMFTESKRGSVATDKSNPKVINMLSINGNPKCAQKEGYCENIESYPRAFFKEVLDKTIPSALFNDIFGETTDNNTVVTDVELKLRLDLDETPLCSVREHTIYPKAAQNRKGKFMYIVNHDDYLQGIRVETCARENEPCMFTEGHLPGYTSSCKQKFIYKKLLAFTPEGKAMPDTFRLPSCCVCHVKSSFISDRIIPGAADIVPNSGLDIQPTVAADDNSWNSGSTTMSYPYVHHDDQMASTSPRSSSTSTPPVDSGSITFPTVPKDDNSSFQVPSPTTSTQSSLPLPVTHHQTGGQSRAENQTAPYRRLLL